MTKKKQTCVLYFRVSSGMQRDAGSIARQTTLLPSLCEREGLRIIGQYRDDGISGRTVVKREGFSQMIAALPKLKPDFVAFLRPDRIGRPETVAVLMELGAIVSEHHVGLLFAVEDPFTGELAIEKVSPDDAVGFARWLGRVAGAGAENKRKGKDVRQGNFSNLTRGRWPHGPCAYGFRYDRTEHKFVAVQGEIEAIRFMFKRVVEDGVGTPTVATELCQRRQLLPKAAYSESFRETLAAREPGGEYRWSQSTVRRIVRLAHLHTGEYIVNVREQYPDLYATYQQGKCEGDTDHLTPDGRVIFKLLADGKPVIDKATWTRCQALIASRHRKHGGKGTKNTKNFLFAPWLACECGRSIRCRTHRFTNPIKGLSEYRYYSCRNDGSPTDRLKEERCTALPHMRADDVDARLWSMLLDWVSRPRMALRTWLTEQPDAVDTDALEAEIAVKQKALAKQEKSRSKWLDLYDMDAIDKAELSRRSAVAAEAIESLQSEIATLNRKVAAADTQKADMRKARKLLAGFEKLMAAGRDELRAKLDALDWHARRTLLHRLLGTGEITLTRVPLASIRSIQKRRAGHGEAGRKAADEFVARWMVVPPKGSETEGVFISGVMLPVNPVVILDALAYVGVRPDFYPDGGP